MVKAGGHQPPLPPCFLCLCDEIGKITFSTRGGITEIFHAKVIFINVYIWKKADSKFYHLNVLEEDESISKGTSIRISYVGYSGKWDEWRHCEDIIDLTNEGGSALMDEGSSPLVVNCVHK